jgi:hypothetical protein
MKLRLLCGLLIVAGAPVQSFTDDNIVFAAASIGRAAPRSAGIRASTRHRFTPGPRFHAPLIGDVISSDDISVTVEQTQSFHPAPQKERKNRIYVPPRWVQGEYGVEILEPGRWIDDPGRQR